MTDGIIIKGIGGFYYVDTGNGIIECRARGLFREQNIEPLVGDRVSIRINKEDSRGYIEEIYPRETVLTRPPIANVSQLIIVMSIDNPKINLWFLDRLIVIGHDANLNIIICINKSDIDDEKANLITDMYRNIGYETIKTSTKTKEGIDKLYILLQNQISVFSGPSGVGKSSLLNAINPALNLKTGEISKKLSRGKHTTRHVELFKLQENTFVSDTPGFSSLDINHIDKNKLDTYFIDIYKNSQKCKFSNCLHINEPGCFVISQVKNNKIYKSRYENYISMLNEIKNNRRF
ncbi:MAG TPA: ribosome small subunit-dependent GTPase A [Soehngenia sp.]|jgi:ribosome small subunit-dependent GTPase A|nr:ribosome small subunit-dependent GTPase A [Soehngenia sp.]